MHAGFVAAAREINKITADRRRGGRPQRCVWCLQWPGGAQAARRANAVAWGVSVPTFPAYSPNLNPIEQAIAKLKAHLRKLAPRSPQRLNGSTPRLAAVVYPSPVRRLPASLRVRST